MNRILAFIFSLVMASTLWAQDATFPHDVMDPFGIPPISGAKCVFTDIIKIEEGTKKIYYVGFDAMPEQVRSWLALLEGKGMVYAKKYEDSKEWLKKDKGGKIDYQFPLGSTGDKQSVYIHVAWSFKGMTFKKDGGNTIRHTAYFSLIPLDRDKPSLDYPKGILSEFGVTDESSFIPTNTIVFKATTTRTDKLLYPGLAAGTPVIGVLEAKFCRGYIPTFAQADEWANALYKACAAHASTIDPLSVQADLPTCHWWTYSYKGVKYQCYVSVNLDLMGSFSFTIRRM